MPTRGWSYYTSKGQTAGDKLAVSLYAAKLWLPGHKIRTDYTDGDPDLEANFFLKKHSMRQRFNGKSLP